jgi:hypothetical protein
MMTGSASADLMFLTISWLGIDIARRLYDQMAVSQMFQLSLLIG